MKKGVQSWGGETVSNVAGRKTTETSKDHNQNTDNKNGEMSQWVSTLNNYTKA